MKRITRSTHRFRQIGLITLASSSLTLAFAASPAFAATAPSLGTAGAVSVAAGTTVTNTGSTTLSGNVNVYPGTAVTGFPPGNIGGTLNAGGPSGGVANVAANDVTSAYLQALNAPSTAALNSDLGGQSLVAGVYSASSGMSLTGSLTLVGDANSVFIFQAVSTLTVNPNSTVVLSGGVRACNVFWQVGSSATLDTASSFVGTVLALSSIVMKTGATLQGRALAQNGDVTLDDNTITTSTCSALPPATTTTTTATTTTTTASPTTTTTVTSPTTTTTTKKPVTHKRHVSTTTTAPPLVGPPVTGGGPTPSHGSLWLELAVAAGGSVLLIGSGRRLRTVRE